MLKKRMSRRQSSVVDKENRKDRWGKLIEKAPVNDSRTQVVVTTDSLKELSAELEKEQSRKKSTEEVVSKDAPQCEVDAKQPESTPEKATGENVKDDTEKRNKEDELDQKRKARHISMGDDSKSTPTDTAHRPSADSRKAPTAGLALGSTNWDDLENHRRKPREEATPPKEQPSVHLLVNNLVRPFTLAQLTDFISHGNDRVVTDLWLDKIKSKAIATFETSEMSERAREELHNLVWPKGSPKTIKCEFLTPDQVEDTKNPSEAKPPHSSEREEKKEPRADAKEEAPRQRERGENGSGKAEGDDLRRTLDNHKDKDRLAEDRHHRHSRPEREESPPLKKIREWDLPKIQQQQKRTKEEAAPKEELPKKDIDDSPCLETFFKKTSAMPPLYWLPLDEEQAIEKAKTREAKQKEDDRQKLRQLRKNRRF
ncbi:apoptotic chromatin condensation inducer in the nucleus [Galendromus occidentalis]|uniref:Apoptotic chromatin condensation inducer in the nucleus n=1 Tax=Galendromus occidentalis TaxID=34638 RepID=A0AAJ6QVT1_9ACAR|nr:apoptotic chromatin condensation inducer in the nucleus [Galendromus occidentalis]